MKVSKMRAQTPHVTVVVRCANCDLEIAERGRPIDVIRSSSDRVESTAKASGWVRFGRLWLCTECQVIAREALASRSNGEGEG